MFRLQNGFIRLLALTLAVGLLATPVRAAEVDKYLPSETEGVMFVNVRQILDSAVVKKNVLELARDGLKNNVGAQQVLSAIGLDPFKDITSLTVATGGGISEAKFLAIVHGSFDVARIQTAVEEHAKGHPDEVKIHKEGDLTIIEGKDKDSGKPNFASFLDKESLVVASSMSLLKDAASRTNGKKATLKKELQDVLGKVDDKQSMWMAGVLNEEVKKKLKDNPQTTKIADKINAVTGSINVTDGVQLDISVHTADAAAAMEVQKMLDGFKALAGLMINGNEQIPAAVGEVLDGIKVTTAKTTVTVSAKASGDAIEKTMKIIKK